jgi:hypothetical protein
MPRLSPSAWRIAWPSTMPTSSVVWWSSMCRSPSPRPSGRAGRGGPAPSACGRGSRCRSRPRPGRCRRGRAPG